MQQAYALLASHHIQHKLHTAPQAVPTQHHHEALQPSLPPASPASSDLSDTTHINHPMDISVTQPAHYIHTSHPHTSQPQYSHSAQHANPQHTSGLHTHPGSTAVTLGLYRSGSGRPRRHQPTLLLAAGGHDATWRSLKVVEAYDPHTDAWGAAPTMASSVSFAGCTLLDRDVYLVGCSCCCC